MGASQGVLHLRSRARTLGLLVGVVAAVVVVTLAVVYALSTDLGDLG